MNPFYYLLGSNGEPFPVLEARVAGRRRCCFSKFSALRAYVPLRHCEFLSYCHLCVLHYIRLFAGRKFYISVWLQCIPCCVKRYVGVWGGRWDDILFFGAFQWELQRNALQRVEGRPLLPLGCCD